MRIQSWRIWRVVIWVVPCGLAAACVAMLLVGVSTKEDSGTYRLSDGS